LLHDGELPFLRSKEDREIAEGQRPFYVGITRAKRVQCKLNLQRERIG
jgi:superfamily I DNA/RNA helicase